MSKRDEILKLATTILSTSGAELADAVLDEQRAHERVQKAEQKLLDAKFLVQQLQQASD